MSERDSPRPPFSHRSHHGHQHHHPHVSPHARKGPEEEEDDPIGRYVEWTENRYSPGYYLGGRLPPTIRALQHGGSGGRMLGSVLVGVGLIELLMVGLVVYRGDIGSLTSGFVLVVFGLIALFAGVAAIRRQAR